MESDPNDWKAPWIAKIASYCGSDGNGKGTNYQSAAGRNDPACAGLRKQPETASHKVVAGIECNSGDAMCDAMKTTMDFKRQHNDCWWAEARADNQFRIPHSENCLGFVDCSINIEDSELTFNDESRASFSNSCMSGGGGNPDFEDAICEQSVKCQLKKKWKRFVAKLENKLPEHLKSSAEKIAIIAIGGIVAIILILIVQQSQNTETRFKDLERAVMLSMRKRRR